MKKMLSPCKKVLLLLCLLLPLLIAHARDTGHRPIADSPKMKLKDALLSLQARYHVNILFEDRAIDNLFVNAEAISRNTGIEENLAELLKPFNLRFKKSRHNSYIIVTPDKAPPAAIPTAAAVGGTQPEPQEPVPAPPVIRGEVKDENGAPLGGVSVTIKGTSHGATTDNDGAFVLTMPQDLRRGTLVFSYVDYEEREISFSEGTSIGVVVLRKTAKTLGDIVVVGYGTSRRRDLTGSISSVPAKNIHDQPLTGVDQALQGNAAGVEVSQGNGAPGGSVSVKIRGIGTVGYSEPLYVVDGVPFINTVEGSNVNLLNTINPNDIASVDILKDASATAIYGARGANGVVIITTRRGHPGKAVVDIGTYHGFQQISNKVKLLDASQFAQLDNDVLANGGGLVDSGLSLNPAFANPASLGKGTDWLGQLFRTAPIHSYNASAAGGNEKSQYAISGGYFAQDGIIINSDFKRYSLRVNLDSKLSDNFKVGSSLSLSRTEQNAVSTDDDANTKSGLVFLALNQLPTLPVYRDGTYAGPEGPIRWVGDKSNPVGRANVIEDKEARNRILGNVFAEWRIVKGLTFKSNWGLDAIFENTTNFEPQYTWGTITHTPAALTESAANNLIWLSENTLTYSTRFGKHELTALGGITAQNSSAQNLSATDNSYPYNSLRSLSAGSGTYGAGSAFNDWSLFSYLGRVNYIYNDRYLLTASIRADGSSRFGPDNKYGVFPSGSIAWRMSREEFMRGLPFINDLKIRASYGATGNQEIGLYDYASLLATQNYALGNQIYSGVGATTLPNPGVRWESVKQADFGIDAAMMDNRVQLTIDYFDKRTEGMLLQIPVPLSSGYTSAAAVNAGTVANKGLELSLTAQLLQRAAFQWTSSLNITFINNKVLSLSSGSPIPGAGVDFNQTISLTAVGHPIGEFYGYVTEGIFQSADEIAKHATQQPGTAPGDIKFKDLNKDGVIDDNDRTYIGSPIPKFTFGFRNTFQFGSLDINLLLTGVYGNKLFNVNRVFDEQMSGAFNQTAKTLNRWRSTSQPGDGKMPRAVWDDPNINARTSDRYVENGSYLRVRNLTIGYKLPAKWLTRVKLQQARVYATAQNLLTITKYQGFDPEIGPYQQSGLQNGVDNGTYPVARTISFGLDLSF
jgi:TonB-linked SusC/RagA family outer membrane protein